MRNEVKQEVPGRTNHLLFLWHYTDHIENDAFNNSSLPRGKCLSTYCLVTIGGIYRPPQTLLSYHTDRIENDMSNNSSLFRAFVAAETCLPSHCLATIGGIQIQTQMDERVYEVWR
jgi:hypothetical protein